MVRVAVLDDWQNIAESITDWSEVRSHAERGGPPKGNGWTTYPPPGFIGSRGGADCGAPIRRGAPSLTDWVIALKAGSLLNRSRRYQDEAAGLVLVVGVLGIHGIEKLRSLHPHRGVFIPCDIKDEEAVCFPIIGC